MDVELKINKNKTGFRKCKMSVGCFISRILMCFYFHLIDDTYVDDVCSPIITHSDFSLFVHKPTAYKYQ